MSHELRTPLNSSLILAKLLADNRTGNLTAEQVKYASTIQAAGNDLLALITDILDLSKIEAGRMEVRPETVRVSAMVEGLQRTFEPVAKQKSLEIEFTIEPGTPETFRTDPQRLEQVLKNLLSNALKFTEKGGVYVAVSPAADARIRFVVRDTGIGIAAEHQQLVFDAFRQADGTTNRKYGGTGLGLSISRELMRLLGGEIELKSTPGQGSTFTITVPQNFDEALPPVAPVATVQPPQSFSPPTIATRPDDTGRALRAVVKPRRTEDDREKLSGDQRVILVIEDDESFARILYDLSYELGFQCLIAMTAEDGQVMAVQYTPNAIVLDMGLPDRSGLSVLDRLKRDPRTRHIPVHVVSANDYSQAAMSLGAVGYMLKPVKREALAQAFEQLENRLVHKMRRVLVVEDDQVQLESLQELLGSREVKTIGARSAAECLERLKETTFDCMVLDLSLPDASGFTLMETLAAGDNYAFPPVIVYTGRDLTPDEEQRLGRYSKSIIIKGAKSPERLLDEVTLFLHQVVAELPAEKQKMLELSRSRDNSLEGRRVLIVEDDVRNVFALTSLLEPQGVQVSIARNGREALNALELATHGKQIDVDLVLMDVMMPEMDGLTATREIRKRAEWKQLPIITLTAKAMKDDQQQCIDAGANDYLAKPLDVERLLSLVRVWMPRK
ncbi:MAG: response regulator [Tepidisphaeraceae bacterium]